MDVYWTGHLLPVLDIFTGLVRVLYTTVMDDSYKTFPYMGRTVTVYTGSRVNADKLLNIYVLYWWRYSIYFTYCTIGYSVSHMKLWLLDSVNTLYILGILYYIC